VPDGAPRKGFVSERFGRREEDPAALHEDHALRDRVMNEINRLLHARNGVKPYEKLRKIDLLKQRFRVGEELSHTFKKRRHIIDKEIPRVD
jgi:long-chain acyl-CoA synthetase